VTDDLWDVDPITMEQPTTPIPTPDPNFAAGWVSLLSKSLSSLAIDGQSRSRTGCFPSTTSRVWCRTKSASSLCFDQSLQLSRRYDHLNFSKDSNAAPATYRCGRRPTMTHLQARYTPDLEVMSRSTQRTKDDERTPRLTLLGDEPEARACSPRRAVKRGPQGRRAAKTNINPRIAAICDS